MLHSGENLPQLDWRSAQDYHYTVELTKEQWAWQFLCRNPEYQRDWQYFITRWRALELDYGIAPHRDFPRWKKDPRAYAAEYDTDAICAENGGMTNEINDDAIFIECWMGAKWGFYKFPQNPTTFSPAIPEDLLWRERGIDLDEIAQRALANKVNSNIGHIDNIVTVSFDVNMPLKQQLLQAKQKLFRERRALQDKGLLKHRLHDYVAEWTLLLRYLDAVQDGETVMCIEKELLQDMKGFPKIFSMRELVRQANEMLNGGYLTLLVSH